MKETEWMEDETGVDVINVAETESEPGGIYRKKHKWKGNR